MFRYLVTIKMMDAANLPKNIVKLLKPESKTRLKHGQVRNKDKNISKKYRRVRRIVYMVGEDEVL